MTAAKKTLHTRSQEDLDALAKRLANQFNLDPDEVEFVIREAWCFAGQKEGGIARNT